MIPANNPGPTMATNNKAQMIELIEREDTITSKAKGRINITLGEVFLAARNAVGKAIKMAKTVPSVAIFIVSHKGSHILLK